MMKLYRGRRTKDGRYVVTVVDGRHVRPLPLYLKLFNHSPTGFEWGTRCSDAVSSSSTSSRQSELSHQHDAVVPADRSLAELNINVPASISKDRDTALNVESYSTRLDMSDGKIAARDASAAEHGKKNDLNDLISSGHSAARANDVDMTAAPQPSSFITRTGASLGKRASESTTPKFANTPSDLNFYARTVTSKNTIHTPGSPDGPAQLALAILADALHNGELAVHLHQQFKRKRIALLQRDDEWTITEVEVRQFASTESDIDAWHLREPKEGFLTDLT